MAFPENAKQVKECLRIAQWEDIPFFVLGRGANTIFGDFEGIVINTKMLRDLKIRERDGGLEIIAQAGVPLNTLVELGVRENLEGIYRLVGFPATVGGAVAMNAGAFRL
jgi:UDP-N-acetylmuramate dehydrogenase